MVDQKPVPKRIRSTMDGYGMLLILVFVCLCVFLLNKVTHTHVKATGIVEDRKKSVITFEVEEQEIKENE